MIRVRFDEKKSKIKISLKCQILNLEKELTALRPYDEPIGSTFHRIYENYCKNLNIFLKREKRKLINSKCISKLTEIETRILNEKAHIEQVFQSEKSNLPVKLYDLKNNLISLETRNKDAWQEGYLLKIREQEFKVYVNLPFVDRIILPKILLVGLPAIVRIECDLDEDEKEDINKYSLFKWYFSKEKIYQRDIKSVDKKKLDWRLLSEGLSLKMLNLDENCENSFIRVECFPRDSKREGLMVYRISEAPVVKNFDKNNLPMTERFKFTQNRLNSNRIRVMSYNKLASCYTDSNNARNVTFSYCASDCLDFQYRRILLTNEIKSKNYFNYNCDFIFLQECESVFVDEDLEISMPDYGHRFISKASLAREGEATLYRLDRFKFIKSYDILLSKELGTNVIFRKLYENLNKTQEIMDFVMARGNVLQLSLVESIEIPGEYFLLANTHLFYHPSADLIRLIQSIISVKYIESVKNKLLNKPNFKRVSVLFAGDFNASPNSFACQYIRNQTVPIEMLKDEDIKYFQGCINEMKHSLEFSAYNDFKLTNCSEKFEAILDYVFYEINSFKLAQVVPLPPVEKLREFVALPNKYVPSDHLALIFEFSLKI